MAALLASDQGGNEASLQATVNIIAIVLAYLAVTLFVVIGPGMELPLGVLLAIPAPILLLQTLQMVLAAGVVARSASAERIEEALSRHLTPGAPIAEDFKDGRIGSRTSGRITDIRHVGGIGAVTAQAPYVGFYLLSMLFTAYVLYRAFILAGGDSGLRLVCVVAVAAYSTYVALFAVAALKSFGAAADPDGVSPQMQVGTRGSQFLGMSVSAAAALGVLLQAAQPEDRTPLWMYFTVWAAIVSGAGWFLQTAFSQRVATRLIAATGSTGSYISAIVYWLILFPVNGFGTHPVTIAANLVLHFLLPLLILLRMSIGARSWEVRAAWLRLSFLLPIAFVVVALAAGSVTGTPSPYVFLRPHESLQLFLAFCAIFAAVWLFALRLWAPRGKGGKPSLVSANYPGVGNGLRARS